VFKVKSDGGGKVEFQYCLTETMNADLLTKTLPRGRFEMLQEQMGLEEVKPQPPNELSRSIKESNKSRKQLIRWLNSEL